MCLNRNEKAQSCLLLVRGLLFPCLNGALAEKFQRRCSHPLCQLVSASEDLVRKESTAELGCALSAIMSMHIAYECTFSADCMGLGPHGHDTRKIWA